MWYRPSQFIFYWFLKEEEEEGGGGGSWGQVDLGNLPTIPLLEDLQPIGHMTSRGPCFNFIKCLSTNLFGLGTKFPLCLCTHILHYTSVGNSWWCRPCCATDKGLRQRPPQYENWVLNPSEAYLGSERRARKPSRHLLVPGWVRSPHLPDAWMACGRRLILHENIIRTDLRLC